MRTGHHIQHQPGLWRIGIYQVVSLVTVATSAASILLHTLDATSLETLLALAAQDMALFFFAVLNVQAGNNTRTTRPVLLHATNIVGVVFLSILAAFKRGHLEYLALALAVFEAGLACAALPMRSVTELLNSSDSLG